MASFYESLESRTMLSVAPSVVEIRAQAKVVVADLVALGKVGKANFKLIEADLKADDEFKSSKALLKTLSVEGTAGSALTTRGISKTIAQIKADVNKLVAASGRATKHPANATLQAKLTAASNTLQTDATNDLSTLTTDIANQHNTNGTNVVAIETANPLNTKLASDVSTTIVQTATNARDALNGAVTTALTTDVAAVIAALAG